jgi:hypothetical protein
MYYGQGRGYMVKRLKNLIKLNFKTLPKLPFLIFLTGFIFLFYSGVNALISSPIYRILISETTSLPANEPKTGGPYSLMGTSGKLGGTALSGARYTVDLGVLNSWRPPQADVSGAHVYPNPCNMKDACTGITITRLTLRATIKIYTISGEYLRTIEKDSNIDSVGWDLKTEAGRYVSSGLYIYFIEGAGSNKQGKMIVIR